MKHKHNPGKGHKVAKPAPQHESKGNLKLPNPSQAMHVAPAKDHMAGNIGNHMGSKQGEGHQDIMESGGSKAPKKVREAY